MSSLIALSVDSIRLAKQRASDAASPVGGVRFGWVMALLSSWLLGGTYLDGWAHTHGRVDQSFFTPWHAVLYTGFLAIAGFLLLSLFLST